MYFTETASLHEIEKLMKMIPNFSPRGHGMICGEERETETISLFKALAGIRYPPFQRRLRQYSKESEMNPMDYRNEKHNQKEKQKRLCAHVCLLSSDCGLYAVAVSQTMCGGQYHPL